MCSSDLGHGPDWILVDVACLVAGLVHVPLHADTSRTELRRQLDWLAVRGVVWSSRIAGLAPGDVARRIVVDLAAGAAIGSMEAYRALYARAQADPDAFWGDLARSELHWFEPFHTVLDWSDPPFARWFEGGSTNLSFTCLEIGRAHV